MTRDSDIQIQDGSSQATCRSVPSVITCHIRQKIIVSSYPVQLTDSSSHLYNILHFCWFKFELIETKAHGIVSVSYIRRDPWDPWF